MNAMICRVVSQTQKVSITTQKGEQMSKCNIRLKCIGGSFADEFWCSVLGPQAEQRFQTGDKVAALLKHGVHENNGNVFNDVTVSGIEKF